VACADTGRGAFQEVDYAAAFGPLSKWAAEWDEPSRTAEIVSPACATAMQGHQGPVVLALPEDKLHEHGGPSAPAPVVPARAGLDAATLETIEQRLREAARPMVILGGSGWTKAALEALSAWLEAHDLPFALSFRRKDLISNDHPCYAGDLGLGPNPKLVARVREADLLLVSGARLGENPTQGYSLLTPEGAAKTLIHIHPGPEELGRVWPAACAAVADVSPAALAISTLGMDRKWTDWAKGARADREAFTAPIAVDAKVNLSEVVAHMAKVLPADAIVCNGAGNFAAWLHRFYRHRARHTQLAPTSGAMGYGFPASIAAKLAHPDREVVCFAGDGDFLMLGNEMATAVQYGAATVTVVVDNGAYGTIRMHQERDYPNRVEATELKNPDFAAYAQSFGAWATTVETTAGFPAAFDAARKAGRPALIHLKTDVEAIAPGRTLAQLRAG
jgi:acetolactate synthase-1/2/3 large subunit